MMRFYSLLLLLSLAMPVVADHHRDHAIDRLIKAEGQLMLPRGAIKSLERYIESASLTPYQLSRAGLSLGYMKAAVTETNKALAALALPEADLQQVRRLIVQPVGNVAPTSATRRMMIAIMVANEDLMPPDPSALHDWSRFNAAASRAWAQLDEASWHIVDAILEEQFGQP